MPRCCIVYTSDETYLFPTLVSAIQARHFSDTAKADVFIFCVGVGAQAAGIFSRVCAQESIQLICLGGDSVEGQTAMLARLFLNRFVPERYDQYLYLDGDTQIYDSLDPLIEAYVPEGKFLAANDPTTFLLGERGFQSRDLSTHLTSIGLSPSASRSYFNSGVLRINRKGWEEIGAKAWEFYRRNKTPSRFPDQDALNIVGGDARIAMSLMWNFPAFMYNFLDIQDISPKIAHFMSSPKPWHGLFPPWRQPACEPYLCAVSKYPELGPYSTSITAFKRATYHLQQRGKRVMEGVTWGWSARRGRVLTYEKTCVGLM